MYKVLIDKWLLITDFFHCYLQGIERPKILVCAVCLGDYSDDANEIVTCDGCRVSVHEGCYGISDSISVSSTVSSCSTEPWFCDACKAGVDDPPCELCPNLGKDFCY